MHTASPDQGTSGHSTLRRRRLLESRDRCPERGRRVARDHQWRVRLASPMLGECWELSSPWQPHSPRRSRSRPRCRTGICAEQLRGERVGPDRTCRSHRGRPTFVGVAHAEARRVCDRLESLDELLHRTLMRPVGGALPSTRGPHLGTNRWTSCGDVATVMCTTQ